MTRKRILQVLTKRTLHVDHVAGGRRNAIVKNFLLKSSDKTGKSRKENSK